MNIGVITPGEQVRSCDVCNGVKCCPTNQSDRILSMRLYHQPSWDIPYSYSILVSSETVKMLACFGTFRLSLLLSQLENLCYP